MSAWLYRKSDLSLSRPLTKEALIELISSHNLQASDEVCNSDSFWFLLSEEKELKEQLGIELPVPKKLAAEENTDTDRIPVVPAAAKPLLEPTSLKVAKPASTLKLPPKIQEQASQSLFWKFAFVFFSVGAVALFYELKKLLSGN